MELDTGGGPITPRRTWDGLGVEGSLILEEAELWWVELPFVRPVETAVGTHRGRPLVLVRLRCRAGRDGRPVDGWGECAALADSTYDSEDVAGAFATLEQAIVPSLGALVARDIGALPSVAEVRTLADRVPDRPLSLAALEMAVGDAHLRAAGRSFASVLGVSGTTVEPGAVLGLPASTAELLAVVERLTVEGYARVKVKVAPGTEARHRLRSVRVGATPTGADATVPGRCQRVLHRCRWRPVGPARPVRSPLHRAALRPWRPGEPSATGRADVHTDLPGREPGRTAPRRGRRHVGGLLGGVRQAGAARGDRFRTGGDRVVLDRGVSRGGSGGCSSRATPAG